MSDEIQIDGKSYISSKRAAELSGYAQDYIGQLARKSLIDARRIGGLWYVSMESLHGYKKKAEEFKPEPPVRVQTAEPGTLIFFDGKEYVSAGRAAELTGYAQDYVGQLARAGTVLSHQVGNRWYVEKLSLLSHKREKDRLLAAVQVESVGLSRQKSDSGSHPTHRPEVRYSGSESLLNYYNEDGDLLPVIGIREMDKRESNTYKNEPAPTRRGNVAPSPVASQPIPIRRLQPHVGRYTVAAQAEYAPSHQDSTERRRSFTPLILSAAATIIIVLSVGYASILRQNSAYAVNILKIPSLGALPASVAVAFEQIGDVLEPLLTHELTYERADSQ
jgi:hypothetical protein